MKSLLAVLLGCAIPFAAMAERYVNPDYECRTTAVVTPTAVERTGQSTKISFHALYRPHFWIKIDSTAYIQDPKTETRYAPVSTEDLTLGQEFWMPDSGEADFSVIFPPLPEDVAAVDFIDGDWRIFGLRVDGKKAPKTNEVDADGWRKQHCITYPGEPEPFFHTADTKISGKISGYDQRLGFDNMLLYYSNPLTGQSDPKTIPVNRDGSFSITFPMVSPGPISIAGPNNFYLRFYAEPGRTLDLLLDWNDMLQACLSRIMMRDVHLSGTCFGGETGDINRELADAPSAPMIQMYKIAHDSVPSATQKLILANNDRYKADIERYKASAPLNPVTIKVLDANVETDLILNLLDYPMYYAFISQSDTLAPALQEPIGIDFYEPMKTSFASADPWIFTGQAMDIIPNHLAFSAIPELLGVKDEEGGQPLDEGYKAIRRSKVMTEWVGSDTVPLLWQAAYAASLCSFGKTDTSRPREETYATVNHAIENKIVTHPYMVRTINDFFEAAYAFKPYDIPDDDRGRVLRDITTPYAGKFILLDFWGTTCGPCRTAIENSADIRHRNVDHPDFKMIFVTGERESPMSAYDKYVSEHLQGETVHRLSDSDFNRLRDLFKFSGIPHYVLLGPDGKVLNENLRFHSLSDLLSEYGITLR